MKQRLQKIMAQANIGSRRACEELIEQKRVRVNGKVAQLGQQADPYIDVIEVDGERINPVSQKRMYIMLNKPLNVVTTNVANRQDERPTVRSLIPVEGHLFAIGRLDAESEGLVVLTNDGELTNELTHPKFQHTRTYKVLVYGLPTADATERWQNGIPLEDDEGYPFTSAPCFVKIMNGSHDVSVLKVVMTEGKKRQIRRIASHLGFPVKRLTRTHLGRLEMKGLRPGEWRELTAQEIEQLKQPAPELKDIRERKRQMRARSERGGYGDEGVPNRRSRDGGYDEDRPRRPRADAPFRRDDDSDRPRRKPTGDYSADRPRRPTEDRREDSARFSGEDRPRRPRADAPFREDSDRPRRPRSDTPFRRDDDSDRPRRPRPAGDHREDSARSVSEDRPRRPRADTPFRRDDDSDRPRRPRPTGDRREDSARSSSEDRPRRPRADTPFRRDDDSDRPRRPRPAGDRREDSARSASEDRPRRPRADTPFRRDDDSDRPRRPRPTGDRREDARSGGDNRPPRKPGSPSVRGGVRKPARPSPGGARPPRRKNDED